MSHPLAQLLEGARLIAFDGDRPCFAHHRDCRPAICSIFARLRMARISRMLVIPDRSGCKS